MHWLTVTATEPHHEETTQSLLYMTIWWSWRSPHSSISQFEQLQWIPQCLPVFIGTGVCLF